MNVTIIGGGFGGVKAALELAKNPATKVTLISDKKNFQYYPALYSSATGHSHLESWAPLGEIFAEHSNIRVYIDSIEGIDVQTKTLSGKSGKIYDYETCIFAIGVKTSYFGIKGLETYSYGIKSEEEIRHLKHRLFVDIGEKQSIDRNYVIVGAGPTGVELAASLGTFIRRLAEYYGVHEHRVKVRLIEAAPRVLPRSSKLTSRIVARRLRRLGVRVELNKKIELLTAHSLIVDGKTIDTHTVIWTSGVVNHPFFKKHPHVFTISNNGRVVVDDYLCAYKDIYVIGDNAATKYTGLAQTAIYDACFVAKNIKLEHKHRRVRKYRPRLPVQAIPVGSNWAAVEWRWFRIYGYIAAVVRRLANLVGYSDILPIGTSLGAWRAAKVYENDYFAPSVGAKKHKS